MASSKALIIRIGIMTMGIDIVLLPFATPETIALLGYQKSKLIGRMLGILLIVVGIWGDLFDDVRSHGYRRITDE
nr:hypothetical protein [uncultured Blautia sp.]